MNKAQAEFFIQALYEPIEQIDNKCIILLKPMVSER
jgi:hypothetical protein